MYVSNVQYVVDLFCSGLHMLFLILIIIMICLQHLGSAVPKEDDYTEMICEPCTDSLPFLQYYLGYSGKKLKLNSFFLNLRQYLQML